MITRVLLLLILATILWMVVRRSVQKVLDRPDVRAARDFAQQMRRAADGSQRPAGTGVPVRLEQCDGCGTHVPSDTVTTVRGGQRLCEACRASGES